MSNFSKKVNQNLVDVLNFLYENPPPASVDVPLSLVSEKDKKWDIHRNDTQDVSLIYQDTEFHSYYERIKECSTYLDFSFDNDKGLKLKRSFFCHVRNCPVCQWRKSLYWKAMAYKTYDKIKDKYPDYRWLFLTLTVENCYISDLRSTIRKMSLAFKKLTKRVEFKKVVGFVRTTEVTRDKKRPYTHAHPHFHCLLLVDRSYFSVGNYVTYLSWIEVWRQCLNVDYSPNIDIRIVRSKSDRFCSVIPELLKYAVKPSDILFDRSPRSNAWFIEYTRQVHKMRFVNSGGLLKNALKSEKCVTDDDMIFPSGDSDNSDNSRTLTFTYRPSKRSYIYSPHYV